MKELYEGKRYGDESMNTNEKQGRCGGRRKPARGRQAASALKVVAAEPAPLHIGIDVGSTTVKLAILDMANDVKFSVYRRHHADVRATIVEVLSEAAADFGDKRMTIAITGSGGLLLAQWLGIEFVQEVIASKTAVETFIPATDVAIELGGEDAKIIDFYEAIEQRINGTCAGGTGAFIDQMAALLNTDAGGLNVLAQGATTPIRSPAAAACSAKTDVQPLINEGARKEDIAASIFQSVVTQTIGGLACGRPIRGHVAFLGGPLQYLPELQALLRDARAGRRAHHRARQRPSVRGQRLRHRGRGQRDDARRAPGRRARQLKNLGDIQGSEAVSSFANEDELAQFKARHDGERVRRGELMDYEGTAYLGIDAGSTTFRRAPIGEDGALLVVARRQQQGRRAGLRPHGAHGPVVQRHAGERRHRRAARTARATPR